MKRNIKFSRIILILFLLYCSPFPSKGTVSAMQWQATSSTIGYFTLPIFVSSSSYVYILTGSGYNNEEYQIATVNSDGSLSQWTSIFLGGSVDLHQSAGVLVNGVIYEIGGRGDQTGQLGANAFSYTIQSTGYLNPYVSQPNMNINRGSHACVASNGYIYALGGYTVISTNMYGQQFEGPTNTVEYSKISTNGNLNAWQYTSSLSADSGQIMGGWIFNGYIYVLSASGNIERAQQNADGTLGQWQITGSSPPAVGPPVLTSNTTIFIIGNGGVVSETKFSQGMLGNWMVTASPMDCSPSSGQSVVYINPYMYVVGGCADTVQFSSDILTDTPLFKDK